MTIEPSKVRLADFITAVRMELAEAITRLDTDESISKVPPMEVRSVVIEAEVVSVNEAKRDGKLTVYIAEGAYNQSNAVTSKEKVTIALAPKDIHLG